MHPNPRIFLSAGEASGDHYGAQLIHALRGALPKATFTGLGGTEMETAGQQRIVHAEDVAVMGITEILRHIPHIYASYRKLVRSIRSERPDVAVLIDFPDVNFRLAKHLKRLGVPVVWFVSPQLWAWKRSRLRWVQQRVSKMMVIFPFEEPFYKARGVDATFVGHPLAELPLPTISRETYAAQHSLDLSAQWIALLPGSRAKELSANLPEMLTAASELTHEADTRYQFLLPVAPTLKGEFAMQVIQQWQEANRSSNQKAAITLVDDARDALHHARASVVASGTATVQAAIMGNPFLIVYRVSKTTFRLAKRLVRYPVEIPTPLDEHSNLPIGMVNLIAGRRIVPELLQEAFTAKEIVRYLKPLLDNSLDRQQQVTDLAALRQSLQPLPGSNAIARVRDAVLAELDSAHLKPVA